VTFWAFLAPLVAVGFYISHNLSLLSFRKEQQSGLDCSITYGGSNHFDGVGVVGGGDLTEEL
jgi:hypothetical protein